MTKRIMMQLALAATLTLVSMSSFGAPVNGVFTINNAIMTDLWSTTLDNAASTILPNAACVDGGGNPLTGEVGEKCAFLGGQVPGSGRQITIGNTGYNAGLQFGTLDVQYDNVTGEILQINTMEIFLQDLSITIGNPTHTTVTITNGNGMGVTGCFPLGLCVPAVTGPFDQGRILSGVTTATANPATSPVGQGTADPDQPVINNDANIFQHTDAAFLDVPDFSTFEDIVDACIGGACNLIGALNIDAYQYRIEGNVLGGGFTMIAQTGNNSVYEVDFTLVPVPAAFWLFGSALGLLGWVRRRTV